MIVNLTIKRFNKCLGSKMNVWLNCWKSRKSFSETNNDETNMTDITTN